MPSPPRTHPLPRGPHLPGAAGAPARQAVSAVELLTVVALLLVLIGLAAPVVGMVRTRARIAEARETITQLWMAVQEYANEHPWHLYPTPQPDGFLSTDPFQPGAVVTQLLAAGLAVPSQHWDHAAGSPSFHCLLDPWARPYRYQLDGPRLAANGTLDASSMNGVADRPAVVPGWNPQGVEPFAYLWSVGPVHGSFSQDADPANATAWVYAAGVR